MSVQPQLLSSHLKALKQEEDPEVRFRPSDNHHQGKQAKGIFSVPFRSASQTRVSSESPAVLSNTQMVQPHPRRVRYSGSGMGSGICISHSFFAGVNTAGPHFESQCSAAPFFLFNPHHRKIRWGCAVLARTGDGGQHGFPTVSGDLTRL